MDILGDGQRVVLYFLVTLESQTDECPDEATVLRDGKPETVLVDEVEVGEHILVRPGEKIPLDADVFEGHTTIDTAALTGESMPVTAGVGDAVCSGCVNLSGAVELVVTKPASESTASKIMELVEESASSKAKTEQFRLQRTAVG